VKLSVLIPTYNRRHILARTLPTVFAQDLPAEDWEVVIAVDGSSDGTAAWLRSLEPPCPMRVLEQQNRGPAAARNVGLRAARGDVVLFLDDDILCGPTLAREHLAGHAEAGGDAVVFGPVTLAPQSPPGVAADCLGEWLDERVAEWKRRGGPQSPHEAPLNHNWSVLRSLLLAHGGYDERLRTHEDADLAIRLWAPGVPFRFRPSAAAFHYYDKSVDELAAIDWPRYARNELRFCRMYPEYAPRSPLARHVAGASWRRVLGWSAFRCQAFVDPVLSAALASAQRFRSIRSLRRLAMKLFHVRRAAATLRAAVNECGSWSELRREFDRRPAGLPSLYSLAEKSSLP
jgi:glycosyltransferase involved in cell wall biosynthesis